MGLQFGGQKKHGHAVNTQGVRSQKCCGESPPCLGAESATGRPEGRNPETDSDATCGVVVLGVWPFATAQLCREHLQKCQQNGAHSLHALLLHPFRLYICSFPIKLGS